ncbi:MAG: hypothetical protein KC619_35395 [Myxococcales bacterium]|nr:hypothetical protein [Myxococcales bacterium]
MTPPSAQPTENIHVPELPAGQVGVMIYRPCFHQKSGTWVPGSYASHTSCRFGTWEELWMGLKDYRPIVAEKGQQVAFSTGVLFDGVERRASRNVRFLGGVAVIDVDTGVADIEHVWRRLRARNVEFACYTTYSNRLPGKGERAKFVLLLSDRVPAHSAERFKRALLHTFTLDADGRLKADRSCVDIARVHYMPGIAPGNEHNFAFSHEAGDPLPVEEVLEHADALGLMAASHSGLAAPLPMVPEAIEPNELQRRIAAAFKGKHGRLSHAVRDICEGQRFVRVKNGSAGDPPPDDRGVDDFLRDITWAVAHTEEFWRYGAEALAEWLEPARRVLEADDRAAGNNTFAQQDVVAKFQTACEKAAGEAAATEVLATRMTAAASCSVVTVAPHGDPAWRVGLRTTKTGTPRAVLTNAVHAFRWCPELAGTLAFNERRAVVEAKKPLPWDSTAIDREWRDTDATEAAAWLGQHAHLHLSSAVIHEAAVAVARDRSYEPFRDYLDGLQWDGVPRLDTWLVMYAGADDTPYVRAVGAKWVISAAARAYQPGAKVDTMLILEGPQGALKSTLLETLAGGPVFYSDQLPDLSNKDARIALQGPVILEIGELDAFSKKDVTTIKSFLSSRTDKFRPPYGRSQADFPRRVVFAGTTNSDTYLRDATGGRRFWSVRTTACNPVALRGVRDQLWGEACTRYREGESWWLDARHEALARAEQEVRREVSSWEELLEAALDNPVQGPCLLGASEDVFVAGGVAFAPTAVDSGRVVEVDQNQAHAIVGVPPDRRERRTEMRVSDALRALGWKKDRSGSGTSRRRVFVR